MAPEFLPAMGVLHTRYSSEYSVRLRRARKGSPLFNAASRLYIGVLRVACCLHLLIVCLLPTAVVLLPVAFLLRLSPDVKDPRNPS